MSISNDNPFAPPKAPLDAPVSDGDYVREGRKLTAGRGVTWLSEGWDIFKRAPGTWVLVFIVFALISIVFAIIPLGSLVTSVAYPVVAAGLMIGCRELEEGGTLRVGHLFEGFKRNVGNLLLVGVLYLVGAMAIGFFVGISAALMIPLMMGGAPMPSDFMSGMAKMLPIIFLVALVILALMLPLFMAVWFAPALVVFHDEQPMAAMKASFLGCLRNFVPFLLYGVVGLVLMIVAMIPFGLGLLVLVPVFWASMYTGYRDIYLER